MSSRLRNRRRVVGPVTPRRPSPRPECRASWTPPLNRWAVRASVSVSNRLELVEHEVVFGNRFGDPFDGHADVAVLGFAVDDVAENRYGAGFLVEFDVRPDVRGVEGGQTPVHSG